MGTPFAREDVAGAVRDHFLAGAAVGENGDDVAHGSRGQEHRRLLAKELPHSVAEPVPGRIITMLLIAHLGAPHRLPPGHSSPGLRVGIEVDADRGYPLFGAGRGVGHRRVSVLIKDKEACTLACRSALINVAAHPRLRGTTCACHHRLAAGWQGELRGAMKGTTLALRFWDLVDQVPSPKWLGIAATSASVVLLLGLITLSGRYLRLRRRFAELGEPGSASIDVGAPGWEDELAPISLEGERRAPVDRLLPRRPRPFVIAVLLLAI